MNNIIIRECTYEDLDYIISMQQTWEKENITYGFTAADKKCLEKKLGKYFFVAEEENRIIGFVYGSIHKAENMAVIKDEELYIEIDDIYTTSDSRSKGIGGILIDKLLKTAKENGIERSLLYSSTKDLDSVVKFYKKHGYKTWCVQMYK